MSKSPARRPPSSYGRGGERGSPPGNRHSPGRRRRTPDRRHSPGRRRNTPEKRFSPIIWRNSPDRSYMPERLTSSPRRRSGPLRTSPPGGAPESRERSQPSFFEPARPYSPDYRRRSRSPTPQGPRAVKSLSISPERFSSPRSSASRNFRTSNIDPTPGEKYTI